MSEAQPIPQNLIEFLQLDIPTPRPRERGFLDVVDHTTRETTICNVYRYFLDRSSSPKLSELMFDGLMEMLKPAFEAKNMKKEMDLGDFEVQLERFTSKGRIDMLIHSEANQCAIIIEAKIYHHLNNNLHDYWTAIDYPEHRKMGVVLGLYPYKPEQINHPHFVSVTHNDWLSQVVQRGIPHDLPVKDFIYFKDFVNNMDHLTHSNEMTPDVLFYLKNADKINRASQTRHATYEFVIGQLQTVADKLEVTLNGSSIHWRNLWDKENQEVIYFTVYPNEIVETAGTVQIIIELSGEAVPFKDELWEKIKTVQIEHSLAKGGNGNAHFQQLLIKTIHVQPTEFDKLSDHIYDEITGNLNAVRQTLYGFLEELKKKEDGS
ncbi:MAG: hypothetical protein EA392_13970 [Cryomorphaceae bacterium]|nr:MAG: hypothetical protein EA392_13970 [Cryomorphaceae bacterium]